MNCPDCDVSNYSPHLPSCPRFGFNWTCLLCPGGIAIGPTFPTHEEAERDFFRHKKAHTTKASFNTRLYIQTNHELQLLLREKDAQLAEAQERIRVLEAAMRAEYIVSEEPLDATNLGPIQSLDVRELAASHDRDIRAQALEEAAKEAEELYDPCEAEHDTAHDIALSIRALKDKPQSATEMAALLATFLKNP